MQLYLPTCTCRNMHPQLYIPTCTHTSGCIKGPGTVFVTSCVRYFVRNKNYGEPNTVTVTTFAHRLAKSEHRPESWHQMYLHVSVRPQFPVVSSLAFLALERTGMAEGITVDILLASFANCEDAGEVDRIRKRL